MKKAFAFALASFFAITAISLHPAERSDSDIDCNILHNGTFMYADEQNQPVKVIIKGKKHTEYHKNGYIKSEITWLNDCEYTAKLVKITLPKFPYKRGTVMKVIIDDVSDNAIFCTGIINDQSFSTKLTKVTGKNK